MSAHTPGPWRVFTTPDGRKLIGIGDVEGAGVTDCGFGLWGSGDELHANARLIAAAPDLLDSLDPDTLEAIADEITQGEGWFVHSARAAGLRGIAKRQRAAITKATIQPLSGGEGE